MLPILQIGPLALPTYPLGVLIAFWAALEVAGRLARRQGVDGDQLYNAGLIGGLALIVVGRLAHVAAFWPAYRLQPAEILGLNTHAFLWGPGALAGALAAAWHVQRRRLPWSAVADAAAAGALVGLIIAHAAGLLAGVDAGAPADLPWAVNLWGVRRHPVQLYAALGEAITLAAALVAGRRGARPGTTARIALFGWGATTWLIEPFRAESATLVAGLRGAQVAGWIAMLVALWLWRPTGGRGALPMAFALLVAFGGALFLWPKEQPPLRAAVRAALPAAADTAGFARAEGPRPLVFPADHGPHVAYQTEWWYYTGNLIAATGERFGYQLTFFRRTVTPRAETPATSPAERPSAWRTDQVYMAHFAITDVAGRSHHSFERFSRGAVGLAGAQAEPFRVWLEDWEVAGPSIGEARLRATARDGDREFALDLALRDLKGPVLQGDRGYSRKGPEPGNASYYISLPRIETTGTVSARGQKWAVAGLSWMDHEFSTSALGPELAGWDWFSLQLNDGTELMLYALRRVDGSRDPFSAGTLIGRDGSTRVLAADAFEIRATGEWRSPRTGGRYPAGWVVTVPAADLRLTVTPRLADQEMRTSLPYWEGAVAVEGTAGGRPA
ncbi:MAG: prolipoprotein diacylglyceryl transferase family protein, partial [Anaerolineae bacterium]